MLPSTLSTRKYTFPANDPIMMQLESQFARLAEELVKIKDESALKFVAPPASTRKLCCCLSALWLALRRRFSKE